MYDVLALVVLACEIVSAFVLAVEPELIRPGLCLQCDMSVGLGCPLYVCVVRPSFYWCVLVSAIA
jgi:uncharacterized membrane protein YraQ (UPF0718 family)